MPRIKEFVVVFVFSSNMYDVVLIKKKRPASHAGLINGLGGIIKRGESIVDAGRREFKEEAGFEAPDLTHYATQKIKRSDFGPIKVHYLYGKSEKKRFSGLVSPTDEKIKLGRVTEIKRYNNLVWDVTTMIELARVRDLDKWDGVMQMERIDKVVLSQDVLDRAKQSAFDKCKP